jgi:peptide/nickel transport system substrate-binding protein
MLAERVARGELPPVEERLPVEPFVLEVNDGLGQYGGAWRSAYLRAGLTVDTPLLRMNHGFTHLDHDLTVKPYVAESWEIDETGAAITWHLRPGMRWSNGDPVTSEDFEFYWFQGRNHPEIGRYGLEEKIHVERADDYTVTFTTISGKPTVYVHPVEFIHPDIGLQMVPSRVAKEYHPDYVDGGVKTLAAMAQAQGFSSWTHMYREKVEQPGFWAYRPNKPTLLPWGTVTKQNAETVVFARNPYFWQVDPAGRQLPYIDHVLCQQFSQEEPLEMMIENGEIDCQVAYLLPHREDAYRAAGYSAYHLPSGEHIVLEFNPTTNNKPLGAFAFAAEVRKAISLGLNRAQMHLLYGGQGAPRQYAPMEGTPLYDKEAAEQYLVYDPFAANAALDAAGYADRDAEGYRLSPEGQRLKVMLQSPYDPESTGGKIVAQVCEDLEALGLECRMWTRDAQSIHENHLAGSLDAAVLPLSGTLLPPATMFNGFSGLGLVNIWRGRSRVPDDHPYSEMDERYEDMIMEPDMERRLEMFREYLAIWKRELPIIGLLGGFQQLAIANPAFRGLKGGIPYDDLTNLEAHQHPQQFYWDRPEAHGVSQEELDRLIPTPGPPPTPIGR